MFHATRRFDSARNKINKVFDRYQRELRRKCYIYSKAFLIDRQNNGSMNSRSYIKEKTNLINLRSLLSLNTLEKVRLGYIKDCYKEEVVIDNIANELKSYPQVTLKTLRVYAKGLPKDQMQMLKGHILSNLMLKNLKTSLFKGIYQINYIL